VGIDGSWGYADTHADLRSYGGTSDCILIRHVLEHNTDWRTILERGVRSFARRMVLVLFTPFSEQTQIIRTDGVGRVDISFREQDVTDCFAGLVRSKEHLQTDTQYGVETVYYLSRPAASAGLDVLALMCAFNEADILPYTLRHLIEQGVRVHLIDNWSTDETAGVASRFGAGVTGIETFPPEGPSGTYDWIRLLSHVEELAASIPADWYIHHDADEIRRSPWPGLSLNEALGRVQAEGGNAVDHEVRLFPPTDNAYKANPEKHFRYYTLDDLANRLPQVKAWRNTGQRVSLASSGGHSVSFPCVSVHPQKFILNHYPIRSQAQGEKKVLQERQARWNPQERALGWHVHYDAIQKGHSFLTDPSVLVRAE
jgi:hypothetical protein